MNPTLSENEQSIIHQIRYLLRKFSQNSNIYWKYEVCFFIKAIADDGLEGIRILAKLSSQYQWIRVLCEMEALKPFWSQKVDQIGETLGINYQFKIPCFQHPFNFICGLFFSISDVKPDIAEKFGNISIFLLAITTEFTKFEVEKSSNNTEIITKIMGSLFEIKESPNDPEIVLKRIFSLANRAVELYGPSGLLLRSLVYYDLGMNYFGGARIHAKLCFQKAYEDLLKAKILRHRFSNDWDNAFREIDPNANIYQSLMNFPREREGFKIFNLSAEDPLVDYISILKKCVNDEEVVKKYEQALMFFSAFPKKYSLPQVLAQPAKLCNNCLG